VLKVTERGKVKRRKTAKDKKKSLPPGKTGGRGQARSKIETQSSMAVGKAARRPQVPSLSEQVKERDGNQAQQETKER